MNELLGWYNFTKSERRESLALQRFGPKTPPPREATSTGTSGVISPSPAIANTRIPRNLASISPSSPTMKPTPNQNSPVSSPVDGSVDQDIDSSDSEAIKFAEDLTETAANANTSGNNNCESPSNPEDPSSDSSRDSISKSGQLWKCLSKQSPTVAEAPAVILCFWCKRVCEVKSSPEMDSVRASFPLTSGDRHFCSEICFNQCRRASFKKSKICDWCRHVRPTVSYVDFTDGNHQLQFCGDKCLNQYKMHIFCRETEAHLQLHPHLNDLKVGKEGSTLITPDLWLKDCDESRSKETPREIPKDTDGEESDEERRDPPHLSHESADRSRVSSCSSFGDESPVSFFDDTEPVNLSTTQPQQETAKRTHSRLRGYKWGEEHRSRVTSRYGRPPKTSSNEAGLLSSRMRAPKASPSGESFEGKPKGKIRVRQLEEQTRTRDVEPPVSSSVSPSSASALPGLTGFGGLLMGARQPLMPGISNLLPPPPPSEIPRPQILPQLLLSHPDLLRLQGLRPPFMLPQPPIQTPRPAPPIPPPPPNPPKPLGFPPVTVLLPLPLPIPIPIPVPIPIPIPIKDIPIKDPIKVGSRQKERTEAESVPLREAIFSQAAPRKERKLDTSDKPTVDYKGGATPSVLLGRLSLGKLGGVDQETLPKEDGDPSQPDAPLLKTDRKERRSILRYTSDVYEINGVFVPRGGGWDSLPLQASLKENKDEENGSTPSGFDPVAPPKLRGDPLNTVATEGESVRVGTSGRKRPPQSDSGDHTQPLPKKKHLLT